MSVKSTVFVASLFLVWGTYSAQADFTSESPYAEEELGAQDAIRDMQALLPDEFPQFQKSFEEVSSPQLRELFDNFTSPWKTLSSIALQEKLVKALEKEDTGQTIIDFGMLPVLAIQLTDAYNTEMLAKRLGFSPEASSERHALEQTSWREKAQGVLDALGNFTPYPDSGIGFY